MLLELIDYLLGGYIQIDQQLWDELREQRYGTPGTPTGRERALKPPIV